MAAYIEKHGGTVLLGKKVQKIVTNNGQATGVTFRDTFRKEDPPVTVNCDNVIANCAMPIVPSLLDEPYASALGKKIDAHPNSTSLLCMYLGFKQKVDQFGVKYYSNFIQGDDVKRLKDVHPNQLGDWAKRSFIFVDYEKVDAGLAPPDKAAGVICAVDYLKQWEGLSDEDYKAKKEEVAQILLQRLDEKFPGIKESVEYYEVSTPKTIKRYTSNPGGAVYGFAQTLDLTASKRFRNNFLIPNLYFASAWAFPGGGFEGSIMAGFLAALQMNKDKIWTPCDDAKFSDSRIVAVTGLETLDDETLELRFEKPDAFDHQEGQYAILNLKDPQVTALDVPYRWLPLASNGEEDQLKFKIQLDGSSFSKSCERIDIGDEAMVFGPMG
ncbi:FAD-dependent oxidoreductase [Flagellimonas allohymeniacidonis]|uniref:FAD-dependent oxidoreductase n=1 Tax=Flagellimonas allohymeniacidonis TaxID=2517819 RepID=UPI002FF54B44